MRSAQPIVAIVVLGAALAMGGCGSSGDGSGYGGDSRERAETSAGTAPAGAAARACGEIAVAQTGQLRFTRIGSLRVTGVGCNSGLGVVAGWVRKPGCSRPAGASRYSCTVGGGYRCLGTATDRGIAVSCARPGRSLAFVAKRG